jgi:uncharacterized membrane protein
MNITLHAVIAFSSLPLFLGALLSDWAYSINYQTQWVNTAAWLMAGGLLIVGPALVWGGIDLLRLPTTRRRRNVIYLILLLATLVLGFINSLIHAKDGWAAMPTGLMLSAMVAVLAATACAVALAGPLRRTV